MLFFALSLEWYKVYKMIYGLNINLLNLFYEKSSNSTFTPPHILVFQSFPCFAEYLTKFDCLFSREGNVFRCSVTVLMFHHFISVGF